VISSGKTQIENVLTHHAIMGPLGLLVATFYLAFFRHGTVTLTRAFSNAIIKKQVH
jgi:hypothetical protein